MSDCERLFVRSGWYDPLLQNKAYVDYAYDAPGYGPIANASVLKQVNESFYKQGGCQDQELACYAADPGNVTSASSDAICLKADNYCVCTRRGLSFPPRLNKLPADMALSA